MPTLQSCYTALHPDTLFCTPKSNQYPFDEASRKVIEALEKRQWTVPGIEVEFADHESGKAKYRQVRKITASDFKLVFTRTETYKASKNESYPAKLWANIALQSVHTPEYELQTYEDGSGSYNVCVEQLKNGFLETDSVNFAEKNKIYRAYIISRAENSPHSGMKNLNLSSSHDPSVTYSDHAINYVAKASEPTHYKTSEIFEKFRKWLEEDVLVRIERFPIDSTC